MSIQARSNEPGSTKSYTDSFVVTTTTVKPLAGTTTVSQSTTSSIRHRCERSSLVSGKLKTFGNKQVRLSTAYRRQIADLKDSRLFETRKTFNGSTVTEVRTRDLPWPAEWSTWDLLSSEIGGYSLIENSEARNESITKAMNNLGDQRVQVGNALAESRKTIDMISNTSIRLLNSYRAVRRKDVAGALSALKLNPRNRQRMKEMLTGKTSSDLLLSVKYGWVPLMSDLYNGYGYIIDSEDTPLFIEAQGSAKRRYETRSSSGREFHRDCTVEQSSWTTVKAMVDKPLLREANRLGLTNPLGIAWELTPYSFLIDWMVPVGDVLQAYSDTTGLTFVDAWTSSKNEASVIITPQGSYMNGSYEYTNEGTGTVRYFSNYRSPYGGFPRPRPYVRQGWWNTQRALTALALLRGSMR